MPSTQVHFGIVGGGLMGLTLALRLAERGQRVTILEAGDHLGGLADAWQLGDIVWDRHYHVILGSDSYVHRLLTDVQLEDRMRWETTKTGFLVNGRFYSLSNAWEFLKFPPLGLFDKVRLAWTIWHASRTKNWQRLENMPVQEWLIRHSGKRTFDKIWLPLLKAKLGDAWQRTNAAFIWATIQRMYAARDGGQKREQFGYVQGGYATILAGLSSKLRELNVQVENRFAATRVRRNEFGEMAVSSLDGREHTYDRVVVTATPGIAARICTQLPESARDQLAKIETIGIVCPSVLLRRPLAGYYVTNITTPAPFTGIIEMSALVSSEELNNHGLVYLPKYAAANDPIWRESDESISERFLTSMCELYPDFERSDVLTVRISRAQHVFTLPTLGYSQTIPPTATSIPGLYLVNSAQIVNGTLNVNETIRLAESSVDEVCAPLVTEYQLDESQNAKTDGELVARPG